MPSAKYLKEFKLEVIRRLESGEKNLSELCQEGLSQQMVSQWRLQLARKGEAKAFPGIGSAGAKSPEIAKLRKELLRLQEENEILKKATAYFARSVR